MPETIVQSSHASISGATSVEADLDVEVMTMIPKRNVIEESNHEADISMLME